jgi:GntR family transcriptional regulator
MCTVAHITTTGQTHHDNIPDLRERRGDLSGHKELPVPKYFRVKEALLSEISAGNWQPGALVPSEPELCQQFGVSRTTVRKAVSELSSEGRLTVVQGRGTFVAAPKLEERFVQRAFGLYEDLERRGITVTTRVLRQEIVDPPSEVARRLHLRKGEKAHFLVRLRFVQGEPIILSTTYIPELLCPGLAGEDLTQGSLYRLLKDHYGLVIHRGDRRLEAVAAGPQEARLLEIALASPLLLMDSVAYLANGQPFEQSVALQRGDRASAQVEFLAAADDPAPGPPRGVAPQSRATRKGGRSPRYRLASTRTTTTSL